MENFFFKTEWVQKITNEIFYTFSYISNFQRGFWLPESKSTKVDSNWKTNFNISRKFPKLLHRTETMVSSEVQAIKAEVKQWLQTRPHSRIKDIRKRLLFLSTSKYTTLKKSKLDQCMEQFFENWNRTNQAFTKKKRKRKKNKIIIIIIKNNNINEMG